MPNSEKASRRDWLWTFTTYFAEGLPYSVLRTLSGVFFRDRGMSLEGIGMTSLYGLPWVVKFLWAPQVDAFSSRKRWMITCQALLAVFFFAAALAAGLERSPAAVAVLFFFACFIAATNDIAIDGYYLEALDSQGQARFLGYRVMAYRIAMMTGTGVIVTVGTLFHWWAAFLLAAAALAILAVFHGYYLWQGAADGKAPTLLLRNLKRPRNLLLLSLLLAYVGTIQLLVSSSAYEQLQRTNPFFEKLNFSAWIGISLFMVLGMVLAGRERLHASLVRRQDHYYAAAFLSFVDRERITAILAFIVLVRTGEFMLSSMVAPFFVDLGLKAHYGWISAGIGLPCSILGAMVGGWLIARFGLKRMILPFLLAQNATNLVYMILALLLAPYLADGSTLAQPPAMGWEPLLFVCGVHGFDQLAGGLGTAVLMTYLMRLCRGGHKAAHYAIGTGLMSISGVFAGILSGFLAQALGYGMFFGVSFLASLPGMAVLPVLPLLERQQDQQN
ncbi:MAG: MFS transporter [Thermodesulfobacteriota bacterium]